METLVHELGYSSRPAINRILKKKGILTTKNRGQSCK